MTPEENRQADVQLSPGRTPIEQLVSTSPSSALAIQPVAHAPLSFRALYEQHFPFTWRSLRHLGVPEAQLEDAAQELWVVVHRRYAEFEGRSDIKTWLFGIAINIVRNLRRSEQRRGQQVPLGAEELHARYGDPALEREGREAWALVQRFVEGLDDTRRTVFVACLLEGMSAAETAAAAELDLATVYNRVRALRRSFVLWAEQERREP
jgi:RNA polymerase sigma-70 factor (ECF subfamily)